MKIRTEFYQLLNELKRRVCILLVDHHVQVTEICRCLLAYSEQGELNKRSPESWLHETRRALPAAACRSS